MKPIHFVLGATCVVALVVSAGILAALALPAINSTREASRRMACSNHLKSVGLGIHNYHSAFKQLPYGSHGTGGIDAKRGNQFRLNGLVALLPFIEQQALWTEISNPYPDSNPQYPPMGPAPWIDADQYPPFSVSIASLQCPSSPGGETSFGTNYAFCYGDSVQYVGMSAEQITAALQAAAPSETGEISEEIALEGKHLAVATQRGMFANRRRSSFRDVLDGLSNTIAMAEVASSDDPARSNAFVARDIVGLVNAPGNCVTGTVEELANKRFPSTISLWNEPRGYRWADGNIRMTGMTTVLPPNSPSCTSPNNELKGVYSAGSNHQGGCHVLMGDGAVIFITDSIDAGGLNGASVPLDVRNRGKASPHGLWGILGTRAQKEPIESAMNQ